MLHCVSKKSSVLSIWKTCEMLGVLKVMMASLWMVIRISAGPRGFVVGCWRGGVALRASSLSDFVEELSFMVDFCSLGHFESLSLLWLEGRRQNSAVTLSHIVMKYHPATLRSSAKILKLVLSIRLRLAHTAPSFWILLQQRHDQT